MREILLKYAGECWKCGAELPVGTKAVYERHAGVFCPEHAPTDPEEIRAVRLEGRERRAERLEGWAAKREERAGAQLNSNPSVRHDWAFITQPGHIPMRARMIASDDRALESLKKADEMRSKAESLRHVVVKGDADRRREERRAKVREWVRSGMMVECGLYGPVEVLKVNRNTVKVKGRFQGSFNVEISFCAPAMAKVEAMA